MLHTWPTYVDNGFACTGSRRPYDFSAPSKSSHTSSSGAARLFTKVIVTAALVSSDRDASVAPARSAGSSCSVISSAPQYEHVITRASGATVSLAPHWLHSGAT